MKKLILTAALALMGLFVNAQCSAPEVGTGQMKPQKVGNHFRIYMVKSNLHSIYYDVEYSRNGTILGTKRCQGVHAGSYTLIGITKDSYSGIKNGDNVRLRVHCDTAVRTLGACAVDTSLSLPTDPITVKLPNN